MRSTLFTALPLVALALTSAATAQPVSSNSSDARPPAFRAPSNQRPPRAAPDMQAVLDTHARLGARSIHLGTPNQVRAGSTPTDAVKAVMAARAMSTAPDPSVVTSELAYGRNAWQKARIYRLAGPARGSRPLIVYYHGGGWVIADLDVYDSAPRMLAKQLGAVVVWVEYRHAPEFKFPAQHDDAVNAYR